MTTERRAKQSKPTASGERRQATLSDFAPGGESPLAERAKLRLLVFCAGAVLMGLEIAGSRVLAPHFGNSVFVWGSLISVFLAALSAGYYLGGWVADQRPSRMLLCLICAAVSVWIIALSRCAYSFCDLLAEKELGEQIGPLIASIVLFLPPSVGMGMVSPFAIRLAARSVETVGKISGALYALSTMGSIAGTLLTTFVLVPMVGLSSILTGLGLALLATSLVAFPLRRGGDVVTMISASAALVLVGAVLLWPQADAAVFDRSGNRVLYDADTPYQHVSVVERRNEGVRELLFNHYQESAIRNWPPYATVCEYTTYFHLAFLLNESIDRTLFIGAGGGVGPREFLMQRSGMAIDVVDIDSQVLGVAREYFHLPSEPKLRTIAMDGRMFLRNAAQKYDCVILDAFSAGGRIPFHLVTTEFLQLCRDRLTDKGIFLMNVNSALEGPLSGIGHSMYPTLKAIFPHVYVFAENYKERQRETSINLMFVATRGEQEVTTTQWSERAEKHKSRTYVDDGQVKRIVNCLVSDLPASFDGVIFTDDYAPIETMAF